MTEIPNENRTDTNNVRNSHILSENTVMNNETQMNNGAHELSRNTTFSTSRDTISISESAIAQNNLHTVEEQKTNNINHPRNLYTTLQKCCLPVILLISVCIIVIILQIPTVLYYTDPPSAESMLYENIHLETCSVS